MKIFKKSKIIKIKRKGKLQLGFLAAAERNNIDIAKASKNDKIQ